MADLVVWMLVVRTLFSSAQFHHQNSKHLCLGSSLADQRGHDCFGTRMGLAWVADGVGCILAILTATQTFTIEAVESNQTVILKELEQPITQTVHHLDFVIVAETQ